MSDIIGTISGLKGLVSLNGVSKDAISSAEQALSLSFAQDFKTYLEKYGVISARHIELTGITDSKRLNVVDVTLAIRKNNQFSQDLYVIEDTGIEGIFILQNASGQIFELQNQNQIKKTNDSLSDYLLSK
ncbi:hypothetical protein FACS1894172_02990 [Spirochaetia bacterium]|nr:hypothetical protein FACS1894172_02990 [Spirochaetia bacterium]